MKQKFPKLTFVRVTDDMPSEMKHFQKGFFGIIDGSYSQCYGGSDVQSYCLFVIDGEEVVNRVSWYREDQLTALPVQDRDKAEKMIEDYHLNRKTE